MKSGSFLLNAARGDMIDESALIKALEEGRIKGAWMDTFRQEPYSGPLIKYPQVILTPHVGSYTAECRIRMEMEAVNNLISGLKGSL
jgi:D-3-phosphoglycerate dehydrogenase